MRMIRPILLAAALGLLTAHAEAHAFLKTATPEVGSDVAAPPSQIVINFTEGVEPRFSSITLQDASGKAVATGAPHLLGGNTHLAVDLKALPPGTYTVIWHATATDTHKTQGKYSFTVKPQ